MESSSWQRYCKNSASGYHQEEDTVNGEGVIKEDNPKATNPTYVRPIKSHGIPTGVGVEPVRDPL